MLSTVHSTEQFFLEKSIKSFRIYRKIKYFPPVKSNLSSTSRGADNECTQWAVCRRTANRGSGAGEWTRGKSGGRQRQTTSVGCQENDDYIIQTYAPATVANEDTVQENPICSVYVVVCDVIWVDLLSDKI